MFSVFKHEAEIDDLKVSSRTKMLNFNKLSSYIASHTRTFEYQVKKNVFHGEDTKSLYTLSNIPLPRSLGLEQPLGS